MADGASHQTIGAALRAPRLNQALAARSSLWAVCRCGREAAVDPAPWFAQGLARHSVEHLEARLRCLCGARRGRWRSAAWRKPRTAPPAASTSSARP
jgi:hypothetical protein